MPPHPPRPSPAPKILSKTLADLGSHAGGSAIAEGLRTGVETFLKTAEKSGMVAGAAAVFGCCTLSAAVPALCYAALLAGSLWWDKKQDDKHEAELREHLGELLRILNDLKSSQAPAELAAERVEAIYQRNRAVWAMLDGADKADIADKSATAIMDRLRPFVATLIDDVRKAKPPGVSNVDFEQATKDLAFLGFSIHFEVISLRADVKSGFEASKQRDEAMQADLAKVVAFIESQKKPGTDPTKETVPPDVLAAARELTSSQNARERAQAAIVLKDWDTWRREVAALNASAAADAVFRNKTIEGDGYYAQGKFDEAIKPYEVAFALRERDLTARNNLAMALSRARLGSLAAHISRVIKIHEGTLATPDLSREVRALTQNNLGIAWGEMPTGDKTENLKQAIAYFEEVRREYTRAAAPMEWATTQNNLGNAWRQMPTGDKTENLKQAIACFEEALMERSRAAAPMDWAMTQNNLGIAWCRIPTGDKTENLKKAITCYKEALKEHTRAAAPMNWAMTQNNLGSAWQEMPAGDKTENLKQAIACYEEALKERTRAAAPMNWATTQNNLGTALADFAEQPNIDKCKYLRASIACSKAALQVRTPTALPHDHGQTMHNLVIDRRRYEELKCHTGDGGIPFEAIPPAQ